MFFVFQKSSFNYCTWHMLQVLQTYQTSSSWCCTGSPWNLLVLPCLTSFAHLPETSINRASLDQSVWGEQWGSVAMTLRLLLRWLEKKQMFPKLWFFTLIYPSDQISNFLLWHRCPWECGTFRRWLGYVVFTYIFTWVVDFHGIHVYIYLYTMHGSYDSKMCNDMAQNMLGVGKAQIRPSLAVCAVHFILSFSFVDALRFVGHRVQMNSISYLLVGWL